MSYLHLNMKRIALITWDKNFYLNPLNLKTGILIGTIWLFTGT